MPDRLSDLINVKDWGATGNGATDDRPALQAAVNEAINRGGGRIFVPAGSYRMNSAPQKLIVGSNNPDIRVDIFGCGQSASQLWGKIDQGTNTYDNIGRVEDVSLFGGIKLAGQNQAIISCRIYGVPCVDASRATAALILDCGGSGGNTYPANSPTPGAVPGSVGLYLGDLCTAMDCRFMGGHDVVYALMGKCPSVIGCSTETNRTAVRVGWGPSGETLCTGFVVQDLQTERCDNTIELYYCENGLVTSTVNQGQIGSTPDPNPTIAAITWSGGTATVTTHQAHNLPSGLSIVQLMFVPPQFAPTYAQQTPGWVIATRVDVTHFTYYLPVNPGAYPGGGAWTYPQYCTIRVRKATETTILCNGFIQNSAYASIDLNYDGEATGHRNNVLWNCGAHNGIIMPTDRHNLAGWSFRGINGNVNPLDGLAGWTKNTVANPEGHMVFTDLPGQMGVFQPLVECQEYNISDGQKSGGGTAAFDDTVVGGGSGKYKVRYNGTNWKRIG